MSKTVLNDEWKAWLAKALDAGNDPAALITPMVEAGFSLASISKEMGETYPDKAVEELGYSDDEGIDHHAIANPRLTKPDNALNAVKFDTDLLQLYTLEDCLTHEECDKLIEVSERVLKPSTMHMTHKDDEFRTSETGHLTFANDPFIKDIDEKIARTLGIHVSHSERIEAQKYQAGQQLKPHVDYFSPVALEKYSFGLGNRTWTFMIYLSEVEKGGGTHFDKLDHTFYPKKGMAVIWNNLHPDGHTNPDTFHSGMPVEEGTKYVITKWFREKGKGPMYYED